MNGKKDDMRDLSKAFTGPQIRTIFGTISPHSGKDDKKNDLGRIEASDRVERVVSRKFKVIESKFDDAGVYLKVQNNGRATEERFEYIRVKLKMLGFFPRFVKQGPELHIVVYPLPRRKKRGNTVNIVMLALTIFTTVWAGSILWTTRSGEITTLADLFGSLVSPADVLMGGITFALPLLLILGTHELGHYFTARRYRIDSSLPYFIPIPPFISPIGTFGALISMKEPMSNRKSLIDIGAAGPIAGFIVAIPVTIIGLVLTDQFPVSADLVSGSSYLMINPPLLFRGFQEVLGVGNEGVLYPTAFAGWIGLFVTALNLLPVGQLDGGHIARGALGKKARFLSTGTLILMVILGLTTGFTTYILFAVLILFMGARHPPPLDDISPLSRRQYVTVAVSVIIMVLTFHPVPLEMVETEDHGLELLEGNDRFFMSPDISNIQTFEIRNKGSDIDKVSIHISMGGKEVLMRATNNSIDVNITAFNDIMETNPSLFMNDEGNIYIMLLGPREFELKKNSIMSVQVVFGCSRDVEYGNSTDVEIIFKADGTSTHGDFRLIRAEHFIGSEVEAGKENAIISLDLLMLNGQTGNTTVKIKMLEGPREASIMIDPTTGNWTIPRDDLEMELSTRYVLGNISWGNDTEIVGNASLTILFIPGEGEVRDCSLQIIINGPGMISDEIELFLGKYVR
ncbi:MAG: site-2 protease family protein [Candidatus Thermoplasmatota archaeon]|nr:site-2 protease family protein [Candidatus Thermoplasmatota archaeon]